VIGLGVGRTASDMGKDYCIAGRSSYHPAMQSQRRGREATLLCMGPYLLNWHDVLRATPVTVGGGT